MSNASMPASSRLRDPLLTRSVKKLLSPAGHKLYKRYTFLSLFVGVLDGLAVLTLVPLTQALVGDTTIAPWMWLLVAIALGAFILRFFATMASYHTSLDFARSAHTTVGDKLATLPLGWFVPSNTGGLSRLVSDRFMVAAETIANVLGIVYRDSAALVTLLVGACFWNLQLGLVFLIIAPVALAVMQLAAWIREKASNRALEPSKELSQRIVEFANHQPALRAAGKSQGFAPLEQALEIDHKARIRELWVSTLALLFNGIVVQIFIVTLITVTADLAIEGTLSPLETIAIIGISLRFTRTLEQLGNSFVGLDAGRIALAETELITDTPSLPEPTNPQPGDGSGSVELNNVTFGYGDKPVLVDVNFHARPGTVTAIVGPSGSGKTTIARLISRFWDVDSGAVMVDGVDIRELGTERLMSRLSMVFQDVYLFDGSLIANIRVGRPDASDEEIFRAANLSGVTSIANRLGWHTPVGEGGRLLSGGERQRVSVARALLKQAPIVLFDEATSALDAENEANILAAMDELRAQSTFIVIAHKLDTIKSADQIVVLDKHGRVSQLGTHAELSVVPGIYRHFWQQRKAAHGWTIDSGRD